MREALTDRRHAGVFKPDPPPPAADEGRELVPATRREDRSVPAGLTVAANWTGVSEAAGSDVVESSVVTKEIF